MNNLPTELKNQIDEIFSETNTISLEDNFLGDNMTNIMVYYKNNKPIFLLYYSDGNKTQTAFFPSNSNLKINGLDHIKNIKLYFEKRVKEKIGMDFDMSYLLDRKTERKYLETLKEIL